MSDRLRVGLIVNPIAGIGGAAGFKGSDNDWGRALDEGFEPVSPARATHFVGQVGDTVDWLTVPGAMGVDGLPALDGKAHRIGETTRADTQAAAQHLLEAGVDLICFVGGDGTATDIASAIGHRVPSLGIPAGVKITSPVFCHDVDEAAAMVRQLARGFETTDRDVTDLDERSYREGRLETRLTGSLRVPISPSVQGGKVATTVETPLGPLVEQALQDWDRDALWLVGAGSVCHAIKEQFWGEPTLLGVDVIDGDRIAATDLDGPSLEDRVQAAIKTGRDVRLLLSPIGGQGMLIGRGTQVLTPKVLQAIGWDRIHIVAPPEKLLGLPGLWVDSGDPDWDASAPKYLRVTSGFAETRMVRVLHGDLRRR